MRRASVRPRWALVGLFLAAAAYHALQSRGHATPAIFTDELLHSKLAQSLAAGEGLAVRGESVSFPAPLPAFVQAPVWLLGDTPSAYAVAKVWNAVVMSLAVFPAYWLARRLVRPAFAVATAAAAVAAPALLYHAYLLSEALAYPVFLLAVATMVRALGAPSGRWDVAVVGVTLLAVGTRTQFAVLPLAFLASVPLTARFFGEPVRTALRRHALACGALVALGALALLAAVASGGAALGAYRGAVLEFSPLGILHWGPAAGALVPFAAGWLLVPGALFGLGLLVARPRTRSEAAFAVLALAAIAAFLVQAGHVAAVEAQRPLERYLIYVVPLLFVAFFAYVERGAPGRRAYGTAAVALGLLAWVVPLPSLADHLFSFDSPTLSAYGTLAAWTSHADAATVFAAVPFVAGFVLAALRLRGRAPLGIAAATVALLLAVGAVAYAGDHGMTERARAAWAASPPDWLERLPGEADYLALPGASPYFGWTLEAWNRNFAQVYLLGTPPPRTDPFAVAEAEIDPDGRLVLPGRPAGRRLLVVNGYGSALELEARVVAAPGPGLTAYEAGPAPRVRSLASGLFADGWAGPALHYQVWPGDGVTGGDYRVRLELPRGHAARRLTVGLAGGPSRAVALGPGEVVSFELRAGGRPIPPLVIRSDRFDYVDAGTPNPRIVAVRVTTLAYAASPTSGRGEGSL